MKNLFGGFFLNFLCFHALMSIYTKGDNVSRCRCIMRIFFENYEKLKYWLYQEDVYEEMIQDPYFADYRMEQCQQDLAMLTEWKNLNTIQDTRKVFRLKNLKIRNFVIKCLSTVYRLSVLCFGWKIFW